MSNCVKQSFKIFYSTKNLFFLFLLLFLVICSTPAVAKIDCEEEIMKYCTEITEKSSKTDMLRCIKKHQSKLTPFCQEKLKGLVSEVDVMLKSCRKQYRKTCRWDINKPQPKTLTQLRQPN